MGLGTVIDAPVKDQGINRSNGDTPPRVRRWWRTNRMSEILHGNLQGQKLPGIRGKPDPIGEPSQFIKNTNSRGC
jgi:hypothetical protein